MDRVSTASNKNLVISKKISKIGLVFTIVTQLTNLAKMKTKLMNYRPFYGIDLSIISSNLISNDLSFKERNVSFSVCLDNGGTQKRNFLASPRASQFSIFP